MLSDQELLSYANEPRLNYHASHVSEMARELFHMRQQNAQLRADLKVAVEALKGVRDITVGDTRPGMCQIYWRVDTALAKIEQKEMGA